MTAARRDDTPKAERVQTLTRVDLVERLGEGAGTELFERLDDSYREGEQVIVANVREARQNFSAALAAGHARVVKAQRPQSGQPKLGEEMVMIRMSDLQAVVKANTPDFSWAAAFAPRRDLPTASTPLRLRSGVRGRKLAL